MIEAVSTSVDRDISSKRWEVRPITKHAPTIVRHKITDQAAILVNAIACAQFDHLSAIDIVSTDRYLNWPRKRIGKSRQKSIVDRIKVQWVTNFFAEQNSNQSGNIGNQQLGSTQSDPPR